MASQAAILAKHVFRTTGKTLPPHSCVGRPVESAEAFPDTSINILGLVLKVITGLDHRKLCHLLQNVQFLGEGHGASLIFMRLLSKNSRAESPRGPRPPSLPFDNTPHRGLIQGISEQLSDVSGLFLSAATINGSTQLPRSRPASRSQKKDHGPRETLQKLLSGRMSFLRL